MFKLSRRNIRIIVAGTVALVYVVKYIMMKLG